MRDTKLFIHEQFGFVCARIPDVGAADLEKAWWYELAHYVRAGSIPVAHLEEHDKMVHGVPVGSESAWDASGVVSYGAHTRGWELEFHTDIDAAFLIRTAPMRTD